MTTQAQTAASKCCNALVTTFQAPGDINDISTFYYVCNKCQLPTDPQHKNHPHMVTNESMDKIQKMMEVWK